MSRVRRPAVRPSDAPHKGVGGAAPVDPVLPPQSGSVVEAPAWRRTVRLRAGRTP